MNKLLFVILLLIGLYSASDICFTKNPLNNPAILENDCMEQLNAICSCEKNVCEVVPNEELIINCEGTVCDINFLSFNEKIQTPMVSSAIFEYLCTSMVGTHCTCRDVSGSIKCDIEKAEVTFSYEDDGVNLKLSEYSKKLEYCPENNEIEEEDEILIEDEEEEEIIIEDDETETGEQDNEEQEIEKSNSCCVGMGLILLLFGFAFYTNQK